MPYESDTGATATGGLDPSRLDVETRQPTLEELLGRVRDGELALDIGDQGREPWSTQTRSRLIESILVRIPLPAFYVDAADEARWVVVDGRRRLAAIRDFVLRKEFTLTGLEYLAELEGQGFDDLARALKRRLNETQVTVQLIKPGTPDPIRFNIFRRINPALAAQEVREALITGPALALLNALTTGEVYRAATGAGGEGSTSRDREMALRFLTFFPLAHPPEFDEPFDLFLNRAMAALNDPALDGMLARHLLTRRFEAAMAAAARLFGGQAFGASGPEDGVPGPFSPALFEAWSVMLARLDGPETERLLAKREQVIKAFTELLHDRAFAAAVAPGSDDPGSIRRRFSAIHDLVGQFVSA